MAKLEFHGALWEFSQEKWEFRYWKLDFPIGLGMGSGVIGLAAGVVGLPAAVVGLAPSVMRLRREPYPKQQLQASPQQPCSGKKKIRHMPLSRSFSQFLLSAFC
ncbi:hypothetical protein C6I21_07350 [Alkalicoccus urumqiensis]|uniref:Uncharacterized protein n=1 Tax=Alkalicoccus urumqiensis TaxID=1548213 RepID=A0A2P6MHE0_ALKUR|nr:hypothetical protein C6I21_07350 [Alkalicoccus urumqiensis]